MIRECEKSSDVILFATRFFKDFNSGLDPFEHILVYDDGLIRGFISYSVIYERAEINYIAVDTEFRNKGIGSLLIKSFISRIHGVCGSVSLEVNANNISAINFYLKNGFVKKCVRPGYYSDGDAYLMVLEMR